MNREWHRAHVLGRTVDREERIAWHEEHERECRCREMPAGIAAEIRSRRAHRVHAPAVGRDPGGAPRE